MTSVRQQDEPSQSPDLSAVLAQILAALERLERLQLRESRRLDEFRRTYLNAKFPHGNAQDRWRRG